MIRLIWQISEGQRKRIEARINGLGLDSRACEDMDEEKMGSRKLHRSESDAGSSAR